MARIRRELGRRVERGVMAKISGGPRGGEPVAMSMDKQPVGQGRRFFAGRGFWLASAAAGLAVAVAAGLIAVSALRVEPGTAPLKDDAATAVGEKPAAGDAAADLAAPRPDASGLVAIPLELPRPAFIGTPKQIPEGVNIKKGDGKDRPPFMAPAGVKNVARKKSVVCSDEEPIIGDPEQITDGDKEAGDGSYVEFGFGAQHVTVDLEKPYEIYAIVVWHYHGDPRIYHDVIVQIAADPDFITGVRTIFNNDHDNSSGLGLGKNYEYFETREGLLVDAKGVRTRYVRLYSNGSTVDEINRYAEVEVYGRPVSE